MFPYWFASLRNKLEQNPSCLDLLVQNRTWHITSWHPKINRSCFGLPSSSLQEWLAWAGKQFHASHDVIAKTAWVFFPTVPLNFFSLLQPKKIAWRIEKYYRLQQDQFQTLVYSQMLSIPPSPGNTVQKVARQQTTRTIHAFPTLFINLNSNVTFLCASTFFVCHTLPQSAGV